MFKVKGTGFKKETYLTLYKEGFDSLSSLKNHGMTSTRRV